MSKRETPKADADAALCDLCGHLLDAHRVCGYGNPPTEGWIECPVPGCACRKTWTFSPRAEDQKLQWRPGL